MLSPRLPSQLSCTGRCRILHRASGLPPGHNRAGVLYERDDLTAKLAVAVSLIVSRAGLDDSVRKDDQGAQLLSTLRETCLAIVESTWLRDLERAYEDSKNRRIAAYEQSTSISELRGKIEHENRRLRREIESRQPPSRADAGCLSRTLCQSLG